MCICYVVCLQVQDPQSSPRPIGSRNTLHSQTKSDTIYNAYRSYHCHGSWTYSADEWVCGLTPPEPLSGWVPFDGRRQFPSLRIFQS